MLREVLKHIEQRERFLLTSHARPDGDAVGSALACCQILHSMGKEADVVLRDGVPRVYRPLPFADRVVQSDRVDRKSTRLNSSHVSISYAVFCLKKKNIALRYCQ